MDNRAENSTALWFSRTVLATAAAATASFGSWLWSNSDRSTSVELGAFSCIGYGGSFRDNEVFLVDLFGLAKYSNMTLEERGIRYVIVPLLGQFKSEDGERYHLMPLAYITKSDVCVGHWVEQLVAAKAKHSMSHGPAFSDRLGKLLDSSWVEMEILDRLHKIQATSPDLIP
jgi:hypothetical protein